MFVGFGVRIQTQDLHNFIAHVISNTAFSFRVGAFFFSDEYFLKKENWLKYLELEIGIILEMSLSQAF